MTGISKGQIGAIHALKARAGLDEDGYRDLLAAETGKRSCKGLSSSEAARVMLRLKGLAGGAQGIGEGAAFAGPYAGICRALWISGWHLGVVRDRTDGALIAFVRRQAGIDHLNWLRDAADATKVIEALKMWLAREAGVVWPTGRADSTEGRQKAVLAAQCRRLGLMAEPETSAGLKSMIARLGTRIRKPDGGRHGDR